jgi:diadenosine tetraphosphate (Ap4A) HIT family hydrolase
MIARYAFLKLVGGVSVSCLSIGRISHLPPSLLLDSSQGSNLHRISQIQVRTFKMACPFCMIADSIPPAIEPKVLTTPLGSAYPVLSTPTVIAFLDIAPVTPGHILLCPRRHCEKATDMTIAESAALGAWLPVLTRALLKVLGTTAEEACWNIIQANGRID